MSTIALSGKEDEKSLEEQMAYLILISDVEKVRNTDLFLRRGLNRRQDHGTRGNSFDKGHNSRYGDYYWRGDDEIDLLIRRRILLRGGVMEME